MLELALPWSVPKMGTWSDLGVRKQDFGPEKVGRVSELRFPTESEALKALQSVMGSRLKKKIYFSKERLQGQLFVLAMALTRDEKDSLENSTHLGLSLHNSLGLTSQQKELGSSRC